MLSNKVHKLRKLRS